MYDKIAIQAIADQATGSFTSYAVLPQHSGDGRTWSDRTSLIATGTITANSSVATTGADAGTTPALGLVRLQIGFTTSGAAQFHLKIIATLRDEA